jgi:hypothetical protein
MEGSEGWERIPYFYAAAGDIQAKPTRVSGGLDLLVFVKFIITGETIVSSHRVIIFCSLFFYHRPDDSRAECLRFFNHRQDDSLAE